MEERRSDSGPSDAMQWPSDFMQKFHSISLIQREDVPTSIEPAHNVDEADVSSQTASQVLWSTGTLSSRIPNGFYSVIPDKELKEHFDTIPSPDDLYSLGMEGLKAEIILVDTEKDKKLSMLKQLSAALVKGLDLNPSSLIKKIACLVTDFYRRPNPELSPAKASKEEISYLIENRGMQLLGQIKHGSCRPRAILFKVLADAMGLESKLMVGLPNDGDFEYSDSNKHMSVVVVLDSVELLVDLMRFPGQLVPFSAKGIFMSHMPAAGESESAEYDSCDSPLEPNSPLCGFSNRMIGESLEQKEKLQSLHQRKVEASNVSGPSLRNFVLRTEALTQEKLSLSCRESNIVNAFWRCSRRKAVAEQHRMTSSSPGNPFSRVHGRYMLSGDRHTLREYTDGVNASRSEGASTSHARRRRRRSISITPEIGDDIVRAVREMNEIVKQNSRLRDQGDEDSDLNLRNGKNRLCNSPPNVSSYHLDGDDEKSGGISSAYNSPRKQIKPSHKAISLPSSPHGFMGQTSEKNEASDFLSSKNLITTWSKVLQSSPFLNKPPLPFHEWNIDFSEFTVGTRVGIGFFGEVFRGIWNGTDVAIKVFLEQDLTVENMQDFCNEVSIISRLRHPNVVLFLGACMKPPHLSMVTEYMEMGSLYYLIHMSGQKKKLNWHRRLKMLRDICRGLMCMHRMNIVHRDLKSANCLVDKHWVVKICDFGLSRVMTDVPVIDNSSAGTPEWMAPELMRNEPFTEKCDIFSLGVIMWELCTLNKPWEGVPPVQVVYAVANEGSRLEIPEPEGPLGKLISDCWAEPNKRPSCKEILTCLLDCEYTLC